MSWNTHIPKFRRFVLQNFPFIEEDFDALTDYALICKVVEYLNQVINSQNELISEVETFETNITNGFNTLEALVVELQNFVNNYFDNLDVQEEINNKLDAMVEDGTMASLIDPILTEFEAEVRAEVAKIGDLTLLNTVKKDTIVNGVNCANQNYIGLLREKYGNNYLPVDIYENIDFFKENVVIYKDQFSNNYACYCDVNKHKNSGGTNIYVDPWTDVPSGEQDGTEAKPYNKLSNGYNAASNGDTILVASGFYDRAQTGNFNFSKSVNICAKDGEPNKVFFMVCDSLTWEQDSTYSNVYVTTRSNTTRVIDIRKRADDCFPQLNRVDSLELCASTLNSYYINGETVYANIGETVTNDKVRCAIGVQSLLRIINNNADTNVYFENITFIGGSSPLVSVNGSGAYKCQITAKNCNFYYTTGRDYDAIPIVGADAIFVNCKACYGNKDGFNYHLTGSRYPHAIEINCVGANNGLERTSASTSNGSTSHAQCKVLRFGGVYFNNNGSNVCDVGTNNVTINIMCKSFDSASYANTAINKNDFSTQDAGSIMKLYNCYAKGSNSQVNIYAHADSTVVVDHCFYDTTGGTGTMTIVE